MAIAMKIKVPDYIASEEKSKKIERMNEQQTELEGVPLVKQSSSMSATAEEVAEEKPQKQLPKEVLEMAISS